MTSDLFKCFEILNAAAMQSEYIASDGTFVFKNKMIANAIKKDAKKNNINFDEASSETEFKIENDKVVIYPSFERIVSSFPTNINYDKCYCYYSGEQCRLVILFFDKNNIPNSFYFSNEENIDSNKEYSFSNVFYWQKIYELFYESISDGIVALLLYLDRSEYSSSYLVNKSYNLSKKYSYNKTNKYYDKEWVKNNFGDEFYKKVDENVKLVKEKFKHPLKTSEEQWNSMPEKIKKYYNLF